MGGLYTHTTRAVGTIVTANIWNSDHQNHIDNQTPQMTDDYSATAAQMQTAADPYPAAVASQATSLAGELERLRYILKQVTNKTYWYQDPSWSNVAWATGNFAATGGAAPRWVLTSGDQAEFSYSQVCRTMIVSFSLLTTTVSGGPPTSLLLKVPNSKKAARYCNNHILTYDGTTLRSGYAEISASGTYLRIQKDVTASGWPATTNGATVKGQIAFEVQE
jgi:hypothetical protein